MGHLSDITLSRASDFIANHMGLCFPEARWRDLERGLNAAAKEFGFESAEACAQWLVSAPLTRPQIEVLASHLTVGETYFLRDTNAFKVLEEEVLPQLIRARRAGERQLRIWSAGCCTGEEAYSIAILLDRMLPEPRNWHVMILATDINPRFLRQAADGVYSQWSFRDAPAWIKDHYFHERRGNRLEILPRIKQMVTFAYLNLAEDNYPSLTNHTNAIDLILCRNVLMYFVPEKAKRVAENFYRCLVDGGWLIVSPTELSGVLFSQFVRTHFSGTTFYRKGDRPAPEAPFEFAPFFAGTKAAEIECGPDMAVQNPDAEKPAPAYVPSPVPDAATPQPEVDPYAEALSLYEQGRYAAAALRLEEIVGHGPTEAKIMALLARAHANQGRLKDAQEWSEKAIAADKLNAGLYYLLATVQHEQGRTEEAALLLKKALYVDQSFALAHFSLGNIARRQRRAEESAKHFANALTFLARRPQDEALPEGDGMTAGRLAEIIQATMSTAA